MSVCTHHWQQIGVDLFRPAIQVRCSDCQSIGLVLEPSRDEITSAFYASEETPIDFNYWQRVTSAGVETLSWHQE